MLEVSSVLLVHAPGAALVLLGGLLDAVAVLLEALVVVSVVLTLCHFLWCVGSGIVRYFFLIKKYFLFKKI